MALTPEAALRVKSAIQESPEVWVILAALGWEGFMSLGRGRVKVPWLEADSLPGERVRVRCHYRPGGAGDPGTDWMVANYDPSREILVDFFMAPEETGLACTVIVAGELPPPEAAARRAN
jgi:hypothetical protein